MSHPRVAIRRELLDQLKTAMANSVIKSWNKNRFRHYWAAEELPAVSIYTLNETSTVFSEAPRQLKRVVDLAVEVILQANDTLDDQIDNLAEEIENAIHLDETINGTVSDCFMTSSEYIERSEGELQTGALVIRFDATYYTDAPEYRPLPNYEGADILLKPAGGTDEDAIQATADVEQ